jgi:glycosyltransferase involved in cell wall biosynthesis
MATGQTPDHRQRKLRIVAWGTYDLGKPRVRILLDGLRNNHVDVIECHKAVWTGVEDKSQITGFFSKLKFLLLLLGSYPLLIWRYLRLPDHDAVLVCYMGQLDVLVVWPFAKFRRKPIVWDAFLSLYDTVVDDRRMVGTRSPIASLLFAWEWLACRAADAILLDTTAHGRYFIETFGLPPSRVHRILVGAEPETFHPPERSEPPPQSDRPFRVLFYGQFIPLHGIETVVRAAKLSEGCGIHWELIGSGQEQDRIRRLIAELRPANLAWDPWVPYQDLLQRIHRADVCLGIFGQTEKAARVIPNKVFQIIASGKPLVTADTPAARELLTAGPDIELVTANDPEDLRQAVLRMHASAPSREGHAHEDLRERITPCAVTRPLKDLLAGLARAPSGQ